MLDTILHRVDIFGKPVILTFSGKEKSKSKFGGICSMIYFAFVFWATYNGTKEFFSVVNPNMVSFESYIENPDIMLLLPNIFPIAVGIQAPDTLSYESFIDESIFKLTMVHALLHRITLDNGTVIEEWTYTDIETEICTPGHFNELSQSFSLLDLDKTYCVSRNQSKLKDLYLMGAFESAVYSSIDIKLYECNNATSKVPCAPQEVLNQYLVGGWFNLYYINTVINPKNYNDPNSRYKDVYYTMITPNSYKNTEIDLGRIYLTTDSGWLIESEDTQNYIKVNKITEFVQLQPHSKKLLMLCTLQASKLENYFTRSYKKVQDILAEIGGLSSTALMILMFITNPYLKLKFREALMNELFDVKLSKNSNHEKNCHKRSNLNYNSDQEGICNPEHGDEIRHAKEKVLSSIKLDISSDNQPYDGFNLRSASTATAGLTHKVEVEGSKVENKNENDTVFSKNLSPSISLNSLKKKNKEFSKGKLELGLNNKSSPLKKIICSKTFSIPELNPEVDNKENTKNNNSPDISCTSFRDAKDDSIRTGLVLNKELPVKLKLKVLDEPECENLDHFSFLSESPSEIARQCSFAKEIGQKQELIAIENGRERIEIQEPKLTNNIKESTIEQIRSQIQNIQEKNMEGSSKEVNPNLENVVEHHHKMNVTVWEFICSFFYKSKALREKMSLLEEGVKNIEERLDIVNILKKLRELDKLTALLLNHEQLMLFHHLPKPEIGTSSTNRLVRKNISFSHKFLRRAKFLEGQVSVHQVFDSYQALKLKDPKTEIDERLLQIFSERF